MLTLTAFVLSLSLSQAKIQVIKGKRGTVRAANVENVPEAQPQRCDACAVRTQELDAREADLNAREKAMSDKEVSAAETEKQKAEEAQRLREQLEKMGAANRRAWQNVTNALTQ